MDPIIQHLKTSKRILITSHANPDGDAIGSMIALGLALEGLQKEIGYYNESPIPAVYRYLPGVEAVQHQLEDLQHFETAVILDCADFTRVGDSAALLKGIPVLVNIDHHVTNTRFGDYQLIDIEACATAEIVYRLINQMQVPIGLPIATAIYTGILTDTGSFRFSNTNRAAFTICMEMVEAGVDPFNIAQHVYGTYSLGRIKLLNLALDTIEISSDGKLSLMTVTRAMLSETGTKPEDVDGLINYARGIEDIKVAALIHELENGDRTSAQQPRFHVSLRSTGDVDVARIAASFGGGGHSSAAGFSSESSVAMIKSQLSKLVEKS